MIETRRVFLVLPALLLALTPDVSSARSAQTTPRRAAASYILIDLSQQRLVEHHRGAATAVHGPRSIPTSP